VLFCFCFNGKNIIVIRVVVHVIIVVLTEFSLSPNSSNYLKYALCLSLSFHCLVDPYLFLKKHNKFSLPTSHFLLPLIPLFLCLLYMLFIVIVNYCLIFIFSSSSVLSFSESLSLPSSLLSSFPPFSVGCRHSRPFFLDVPTNFLYFLC
jgi:hypothetical protein